MDGDREILNLGGLFWWSGRIPSIALICETGLGVCDVPLKSREASGGSSARDWGIESDDLLH